MKEYYIENGHNINIEKLQAPRLPMAQYGEIHKLIIRPCHDIFIAYWGGILLVTRRSYPAKDILWPVGGGLERGVAIQDSLKRRAKVECNLELEDIIELGSARTFFETDPFGHGKGTDTVNFVYFARGKGELKLDASHSDQVIVLPEQYDKLRNSLHPYVQDFMDLAMPLLKK